ncbi:Probable 1-acyl-sn-glycerol-3-phosphate acyltransferase 4 [Striga hermonthica]|uniref:1-acylglycerol-3-phosphate O-acyltransferase n=1 Tax=Striga hermonthica TaxID=68872 RepID=A0A9N7RGT8_STRHE|nr:Probable 1-acyl-sn-glycerol-3-phosphate acyltransferase 4 [Striga hermonthica]
MSNHRTEVDWMYLWNLALRKGCLGYIKYVLKSSLMKLPIFGWGFHVLEFVPVERKWEVDEPVMRQMLETFTDPRDPLWLAVFPEGTDYTEKKCKNNQKFAIENGLPVLKNVLVPKTRGFLACLEILRVSLDAVYDVTIAYKNQCPSFTDNVFGVDPTEVHMHIKRIPLDKIPSSENEAATWLMDAFVQKDQLLTDFVVNVQEESHMLAFLAAICGGRDLGHSKFPNTAWLSLRPLPDRVFDNDLALWHLLGGARCRERPRAELTDDVPKIPSFDW